MSGPPPAIGRWRARDVLAGLLREVDTDGWRLRRDPVDVHVYSKPGVFPVDVHVYSKPGVFACPGLAFEGVSAHPIPAGDMARCLGGRLGRLPGRWLRGVWSGRPIGTTPPCAGCSALDAPTADPRRSMA